MKGTKEIMVLVVTAILLFIALLNDSNNKAIISVAPNFGILLPIAGLTAIAYLIVRQRN